MSERPARDKAEFIWDEPRPAVEVPRRLAFRPALDAAAENAFSGAAAASLVGSSDQADRRALADLGADGAASRHLEPDGTFAFERGWWHLAHAGDGALVGLTQPVVFRGCGRGYGRGCGRGGLEEGTIHHIGVVPAQRGHGYVADLLRHATATLQAVGIWRIYCDTDVRNAPMIGAFERAGYRRGRVRSVPFARPVPS